MAREDYNRSHAMCEGHRTTLCYNCLGEGIRQGPRVKQALCADCKNEFLEFKIESGTWKDETVRTVEEHDPDYLYKLYYKPKKAVTKEELPLREHIKKNRWAFKLKTLQLKKD